MSRLLPLALLLAAGCVEPHDLQGRIDVDLRGDAPVFDFVDLGRSVPTALWVLPRASCQGAYPAVWEVRGIPEEAWPVAYGEVPRGAREVVPPRPLVAGGVYWAEGAVPDHRDLSGVVDVWAGTIDWTGYFVWGDSDSFQVDSEFCASG